MSDAIDKDAGEKKTTRGNRGKGRNNKLKEKQSLQDEVIEILRAEGYSIIPPIHKKSTDGSKNKVKLSKDTRVPKDFKTFLEVDNCPEIKGPKSKKKNKAKENDLSNTKNTETKAKESDQLSTKNTDTKVKKNDPSTTDNTAKNAEESIPLSVKSTESKLKASKKKRELPLMKKECNALKKKKKNKSTNLTDVDNKHNEKKSKRTLKKFKENDIFKKELTFPRCISKRDMLDILTSQNSEDPTYVKGHIRINPKSFNHAYLNIGRDVDILISGVRDRNTAMDGDLVVAMINPKDEWFTHENGEIQKTGTVVCILEKIHLRKVVGTLVMQGDRFKLKCRDQRVPVLVINSKTVPKEVKSSPEAHKNTLFLAKIDIWLTPYDCRGRIERIMGEIGDLEGETTAILLTNGLDVTPYDDELIDGLPSSDYVPVPSDFENREDWRDECVFTIDPATAVDLDDAVSCKKLPNGNYEVGVHIADVTHYLKAFSPLDEKVSERATTVYLVNTVYHMLPKSLCNLCSLVPGHEKLSFSVIWEMTPEAKVVKHRFTKSVIKSCYQMAYEKAQAMIDETSREWIEADLPGLEGNFSPNHICETVNNLYKLSTQMRDKRFADGALSINLPKLQIILDKETRIPISYRIEERQDSNRLIEEFMLLANITVAKHLYDTMPDTAFLRIHGEPLDRVLSRTAEELGHLGVHLNTESASSLQSSLALYEEIGLGGYEEKFATNCRMMVINTLCAQSMPRATYTCSGMIKEVEDLRHFALNVPFYTHFTSPIRRYADCVVHRLLFASMTNTPLPTGWSADLCAKFAANCNGKKYSAKVAQEKSNELYFMDLLSRKGPTETMAIVMKVQQRRMDVILCHVGIKISLNYSDIEKMATIQYNKEHCVSTIIVKWKASGDSQMINVFSMINLRIEKHPKNYSIRGVLLPSWLSDATTGT